MVATVRGLRLWTSMLGVGRCYMYTHFSSKMARLVNDYPISGWTPNVHRYEEAFDRGLHLEEARELPSATTHQCLEAEDVGNISHATNERVEKDDKRDDGILILQKICRLLKL